MKDLAEIELQGFVNSVLIYYFIKIKKISLGILSITSNALKRLGMSKNNRTGQNEFLQ